MWRANTPGTVAFSVARHFLFLRSYKLVSLPRSHLGLDVPWWGYIYICNIVVCTGIAFVLIDCSSFVSVQGRLFIAVA